MFHVVVCILLLVIYMYALVDQLPRLGKREPICLLTCNKTIKMSSFKSSKNIQKKEGGPDKSVSDNQFSSVTLNELAMKARKVL